MSRSCCSAGCCAADLVEQGQVRLERVAGGRRGASKSRGRSSYFSEFRYSSLPGSTGSPLVELVAGVHAPGRGERRGQGGPDGEHRRAAGLQRLVQDVRGVDEQVRPGLVGALGVHQGELGELGLRRAPGEVGVGLGEAQPGQPEQPGRPGERLGQEQHVRVAGLDLPDQPVPEVRRLGVRVVDAEDPHPVLDPVQHHPQRLGVDAGRVVVEVDRVDVLVALRRVLRVGDGAVRAHGEPLRVLGHPRVVRRALQREVQRDLHAEVLGARCTNASKSSMRAQLRVDRVVAALGRADRPRRADVAGPGVARELLGPLRCTVPTGWIGGR